MITEANYRKYNQVKFYFGIVNILNGGYVEFLFKDTFYIIFTVMKFFADIGDGGHVFDVFIDELCYAFGKSRLMRAFSQG